MTHPDKTNRTGIVNLSRRSLLAGASVLGAGSLFLPQLSLAQAASTASGTAAAASPAKGGTAVFSYGRNDPTLLSNIDRSGVEAITNKIIEGLVTFDFDQNPQPSLARSWNISDDGLRYTFNLEPGVKWHDGQPFTSADVAYSIKTLRELHPRRRATFANIVDIETPDDLTVTLVLSSPAPYLLGALEAGSAPIFARHLYEGKDFATNPANLNPVGTGPFVFKEWVRGSHVLVERNPAYRNPAEPLLDRIIFRIIPDASARVAGFEAGEIDVGNSTPVPISEVERLKALPHLEFENKGYVRAGQQSQLFFNLDNPILQNRQVRQAIAHAVNPAAIRDIAFSGQARLSPAAIVPNGIFNNPNIAFYAFDQDQARKLLDEAGYPDKEGGRFPIRILYAPWLDALKRVAETVRAQLREVGINAQVESYDYATFANKVYSDRAFDIDVEALQNGYDPLDGVHRVYWSKAFKVGLQFSNPSHYVNPEVDALLEAASKENDLTKRRELYHRFQEIVHEDLPAINTVEVLSFTVANRRLKKHTVDAVGATYDFSEAYIEKA